MQLSNVNLYQDKLIEASAFALETDKQLASEMFMALTIFGFTSVLVVFTSVKPVVKVTTSSCYIYSVVACVAMDISYTLFLGYITEKANLGPVLFIKVYWSHKNNYIPEIKIGIMAVSMVVGFIGLAVAVIHSCIVAKSYAMEIIITACKEQFRLFLHIIITTYTFFTLIAVVLDGFVYPIEVAVVLTYILASIIIVALNDWKGLRKRILCCIMCLIIPLSLVTAFVLVIVLKHSQSSTSQVLLTFLPPVLAVGYTKLKKKANLAEQAGTTNESDSA